MKPTAAVANPVTKRVFLAARECLARGRFARDADRAPITHELQWLFWTGNQIGRLAREFLGAGHLLPTAPVPVALDASQAALAEAAEGALLYECTFAWRSFIARADALRRTANGWELLEVKSGKSDPEGKVKDEYIEDIAYTIFVARAAGCRVEQATLVLINHEYVLDVPPLFACADVSASAFAMADVYAAEATAIEAALLAEERPTPALQYVCKKCEYFEDRCVGKGVPDPLFAIPRLMEKRFEEIRQYERVSRIPASVKFTVTQQRVVDMFRSGQPYVNAAGLALLDDVAWPAYYLDFEAVSPALPWFEGNASYETLLFQYSLDVCRAPGEVVAHHELLADVDGDWRRGFAESLLDALGTAGSIVVYSSYEKARLGELAQRLPDLQPRIDAVIARLWDLEKVFREGYAHPDFGGRTSIKKVLPVLTTESYASLAVGDGGNASALFGLMRVGEYPAETHAEHRANLLAYCGLDTMAMVRLHAEVCRIRRGLSGF